MRLILCFLLFTLMLNGQKIVLEKTYGGALKEQLIDVEPTSDGGFGLLGVTFSYGNGGNDYYLVRINSSGDTLWTKTFGAGENDSGMSLVKTSDGGFILAGTKVLNSKGNGWVLKVSSTGIVEWEKSFGGSGNDYFRDVIETKNGTYLACGFTNSSGAGDHDAYVVSFDASGNKLWDETIGGALKDEGRKILELSNNEGFIVAGFTTTSGGTGADYLVAKIDSLGNVLWTKNFGNTGEDVAWDVCQAANGLLYVIGEGYNSSNASKDFYLCKTDLNGLLISDSFYGGLQEDLGRAIVSISDSLYVFGETSSFGNGKSDLMLLSADSNLVQKGMNTYGGTGVETAWTMKNSGSNLFLAGNYDSESSTGVDFYFLNLELAVSSPLANSDLINNVVLFPTISSSLVTLLAPKNSEVKIYNSLGQEIRQFNTGLVLTTNFSVADLNSGIYTASVCIENQPPVTVRFIKQN